MSDPSHGMIAVLPCNDLDASEAFYGRLGFTRPEAVRPVGAEPDVYRMLADGQGGVLHLSRTVEGWLVDGRNPFGLYLRTEAVDRFATAFKGETVEKEGPEDKPWGMYEFSLSDPDGTLVRVGWPSRLRIRRDMAALYDAFNRRDVDAVLARLHPQVTWHNGWEGGVVIGREAVRDYWNRQWAQIDPIVTPQRIISKDGKIIVEAKQVVRNKHGAVLSDGTVEHVYSFQDGLISAMEIRRPA
jgi:predicted lactoylglutathione lyase/ketosteroid isomerase-like protein